MEWEKNIKIPGKKIHIPHISTAHTTPSSDTDSAVSTDARNYPDTPAAAALQTSPLAKPLPVIINPESAYSTFFIFCAEIFGRICLLTTWRGALSFFPAAFRGCHFFDGGGGD